MAAPALDRLGETSAFRAPKALYGVLALFLIGAVVVTAQRAGAPAENNFRIFRAAFQHLVAGQDLYAAYPAEHADLYKYSPTFALLFAPFALLPVVPAYFVWQVVSILAVVVGMQRQMTHREMAVALVIAWPSVVTDMQRAQTNTVCAGLMLIAWSCFERREQLAATLSGAVGAFVKIFPLAAFAGLLLYPRKIRQFALIALVMAVGAVLPLLVTSPSSLLMQYESWLRIETLDAVPVVYGLRGGGLYAGLMGGLHVWFGVDWPHWPVQLAGVLIVLASIVLRRDRWHDAHFRLQLIASILIFAVLFNHQSESPSYVIAMLGIAVWFATSERAAWRVALIVFAMLFVNGGSSGILSRDLYQRFYLAYLLKTVPLIPIWIILQLELHGLIRNRRDDSELGEADPRDVAGQETVAHRR
jgi:hypothetical protein